ncbi:hypothetical protein Tco_0433288, partial [Tanacetum coccineum]
DQYRVVFLSLLDLKDHRALVLMDDLLSICILKGTSHRMCAYWKGRLNEKKIQLNPLTMWMECSDFEVEEPQREEWKE